MKGKINLGILRNNKGQNLVEFALVVPLLFLILIGIAEFGRAWMTQNIITGASREAVRMYAVKDDFVAANARAVDILESAHLDPARWTIAPPIESGVAVSFDISYDFPLVVVGFIPGLSNRTITLRSTTTMRKEY